MTDQETIALQREAKTIPVKDARCEVCMESPPTGRLGSMLLCPFCAPAFVRLDEYFGENDMIAIPDPSTTEE